MLHSSCYFFTDNSRNPTVFHLKQFFDACSYLRVKNNRTTVFDSQLKSSVAEYQKHHRLKSQEGSLNAETYEQIGKEMTDVQVSIISLHSPLLKSLLYANSPNPILGEQRFFIIGFSDEQHNIINEQVKFMVKNPACSKAFEDAGLVSVNSMVFNGGLIVVSEKTLSSKDNNPKWDGTEVLRKGMWDIYGKDLGINGVTPVGPQNDKYYVSLRDRAFTGWDGSPEMIVAHELVHAGGAEGNKNLIEYNQRNPKTRTGMLTIPESYQVVKRPPKHDLEWMNYKNNKQEQYVGNYDVIIKASRQ